MKTPNEYRTTYGPLRSDDSFGNNGLFEIPFRSITLQVICSDGGEWDHVSVSLPNRCPNWEEMSFIKSLFWEPDECVVQYHPPEKQYVDNHPYCLHMWKPQNQEIPLPPTMFV